MHMADRTIGTITGFGDLITVSYAQREEIDGNSGLLEGFDMYIADDCDGNEERATILHEIVHYIDQFTCAGLTEEQITAITNGLFGIIKLNRRNATFMSIMNPKLDGHPVPVDSDIASEQEEE